MRTCRLLGSWCLTVMALIGCGSDSATPLSEPSAPQTTSSTPVLQPIQPLPESEAVAFESDSQGVVPASAAKTKTAPAQTASATDTDDNDSADVTVTAPEKDSGEEFILRITQLKLKPLKDAKGSEPADGEKLSELRKQRNEELIKLATEAIARTHNDSAKQRVFDLAVHHLLEAELQLALAGDQEHIDAIHEHATLFYERDPKSKSAVEAGQTLVTFARVNAQRYGQQEPKWVEEFSRLTRQFSKNFPQEERLAIPMLFAAGQSCEFHGLTAEATLCYATIRDQYPENSSVERVTPILRRLNIKGKPLQLAGPMLGGGFLKAEELKGRPLLVVFWTTTAQPFVRQLSTLKELLAQIPSERLNVVSVNLDDDDNESAIEAFLESNGLRWPTIFQTEPEQRGWNNPNATYYGIHSVPQYWVISSKGNVVETAHDVRAIEPLLQKLVAPKSESDTK